MYVSRLIVLSLHAIDSMRQSVELPPPLVDLAFESLQLC